MASDRPPTRPFWRSLDELVASDPYADWTRQEFSPEALEAPKGMNRREMLKLAAASFVLSTLASCSRVPEQEIVPYVHAPADRTPARPEHFAPGGPPCARGFSSVWARRIPNR